MKKKIGIFFTVFLLMTFTALFCGKSRDPMREPGIGEAAPDFTLKNQDQANVQLSDFRGKKNVILVYYPLDFTPV